MSINLEDRPIESVREEVVDALIYNYSQSNINELAFERRLDIAMESTDVHEIFAQSADLATPQDNRTVAQNRPSNTHVQLIPDSQCESETIINIFGGSERTGPWRVPSEINTVCIFGGAEIDLSHATFTAKQTTMKVFCLFGGLTINVPEGLQVSTSTVCIFGGAGNKVRVPTSPENPVLRIEGFIMFGGLDIQIKKTMKEKFVAFANQMKTLFDTRAKL